MENIIEKVKDLNSNYENAFNDWNLQEKQQLLDLYLILSKKEAYIFDLIYRLHECEGWEKIFRCCNIKYLEAKSDGVEIAIERIMEQINREKNGTNK